LEEFLESRFLGHMTPILVQQYVGSMEALQNATAKQQAHIIDLFHRPGDRLKMRLILEDLHSEHHASISSASSTRSVSVTNSSATSSTLQTPLSNARALSPSPRGAASLLSSPKPVEKRAISTPRASPAQQALSVGLGSGRYPPSSPAGASRSPLTAAKQSVAKSPRGSGGVGLDGEVADSDEEPVSGSDSDNEGGGENKQVRKATAINVSASSSSSPSPSSSPEPEARAVSPAPVKNYGVTRNTMHDNMAGLATAAAHKVSVFQNNNAPASPRQSSAVAPKQAPPDDSEVADDE